MSLRWMPAKTEEISTTASAISAGSRRSTGSGKASMPASLRRNAHLASRAGSDASGPRSPWPTTELPSLTTMTLLPLIVYSQACSKSWWIAMQTRATPGV